MLSERDALLLLLSIEGVGQVTLRRLLERYRSAKSVVLALEREGVSGLQSGCRQGGLAESCAAAKALGKELEAARVLLLRQGEPLFPRRIAELPVPPAALFLQGDTNLLGVRSVAVVGKSRPSAKGARSSYETARRLSREGICVVSGNAAGVDFFAHKGALDAGGRSIFVLPTGILRFVRHFGLPPRDTLLERALLVSELHPLQSWATWAALARNRLIAALPDAVVSFRGDVGPGARRTLDHARQLGRKAAVLSGPDDPALDDILRVPHGERSHDDLFADSQLRR